MNIKLVRLFFLLTIINFNSNAQIKPDSLTAYDIVNYSIDAMGGLEYLKSIKTLYSDTKTVMEGRQVHWIVREMIPNKGSFQIIYNNRTVHHDWFNGKDGFEIIKGERKKVEKAYFKDKEYKKNIFNELDYLDSTLWRLEYLNAETINNDSSYKIKASLVNGLVVLLYFDKKSFHMIRSDKIENPEKDRFTTCLYSNFKRFGQLVYHTEMDFGQDGKYQHGTVVEVLINQSVTEGDFK